MNKHAECVEHQHGCRLVSGGAVCVDSCDWSQITTKWKCVDIATVDDFDNRPSAMTTESRTQACNGLP